MESIWLGLCLFCSAFSAGVGPRGELLRSEYFVLREGERAQAISRWIQRRSPSGYQLEWETRFAEGPRASLVEVHNRDGRRLIWREHGAGAPTWMIEIPTGEAWMLETRWGLGGDTHRRSPRLDGAEFPLQGVEAARGGSWDRGARPYAVPLAIGWEARCFQGMAVPRTWPAGSPGWVASLWPEGVDTVVQWKASGDSGGAGTWTLGFAGRRLVAYRLRSGGPWWQAVSAQEYQRLEGSLGLQAQAIAAGGRIQGDGQLERPK